MRQTKLSAARLEHEQIEVDGRSVVVVILDDREQHRCLARVGVGEMFAWLFLPDPDPLRYHARRLDLSDSLDEVEVVVVG